MSSRRILMVSCDDDLIDDVVGLSAAHGVDVHVVRDAASARASWQTSSLVVIGADSAAAVAAYGLSRRTAVVLVTRSDPDALWQSAVEVGAEHVVHLPDGERWMLDRLAEVVEDPARNGSVLAVMAASGGAGASTFAATVSRCLSMGMKTVLIDADPLGGGIELILGMEDTRGVRWPDLAQTRGRLSPANLADALPRCGDVSVLSWTRAKVAELDPGAFPAVIDAAIRAFDAVVIDLPRGFGGDVDYALGRTSLAALVATSRVRSIFAASRVHEQLAARVDDVQLVVRAESRGLGSDAVGQAVGRNEAVRLPFSPKLALRADAGELASMRDPYARACAAFLRTWVSARQASQGRVA